MGSPYIEKRQEQESSEYCRGLAIRGALAASEWQSGRCFRHAELSNRLADGDKRGIHEPREFWANCQLLLRKTHNGRVGRQPGTRHGENQPEFPVPRAHFEILGRRVDPTIRSAKRPLDRRAWRGAPESNTPKSRRQLIPPPPGRMSVDPWASPQIACWRGNA